MQDYDDIRVIEAVGMQVYFFEFNHNPQTRADQSVRWTFKCDHKVIITYQVPSCENDFFLYSELAASEAELDGGHFFKRQVFHCNHLMWRRVHLAINCVQLIRFVR